MSTYSDREKNYCDLLYAWLYSHSEPIDQNKDYRRIERSKIKWTRIEDDFTNEIQDGTNEKIMNRKTIAKYFNSLLEKGLVYEKEMDFKYYYLAMYDNIDVNLIEYKTLSRLMNTLQKTAINVYIYLFNRYYVNRMKPFIDTIDQIKDQADPDATTLIISDSLNILKQMGLISYSIRTDYENDILILRFESVKNQLPQ